MICRTAMPSASWSMPSLICVEVDRRRHQRFDREPARPPQLDEPRDVPRGHRRAEVAADQRPALGDETQRRHGDSGIGPRQADGDGAPARRGQTDRGLQRRRMARGLDHDLGLEIADPIRRVRLVGAQLERPVQLVLDLVDGHDAHAVVRERGQHRGHADPAHADHGHRLPRRGAARVEDGATAGEHRTPQQGRHHRRHVAGRPARPTGGRRRRGWRTPRPRGDAGPGCRRRGSGASRRPSSVPAPLAALPATHGARPSVAHALQSPQRGRNVMTTRCPTAMSRRQPRRRPARRSRPPRGRAASAPA